MKNRGALILTMSTLLAFGLGTAVFGDSAGAAKDGCKPPGRSRALAAARPGAGTAAVQNGRVIAVAGDDGTDYFDSEAEGVARHVAVATDGVAFIDDLEGDDRLVTVREGKVQKRELGGELLHPTWFDDGRVAVVRDMEEVLLVDGSSGETETVHRPPGTEGIFSAVATSDDRLYAVGIEPVPDYPGHLAALDNLYHFSFADGEWERLTDFTADADRWSLLRTPVAGPNGVIDMVRVSGHEREHHMDAELVRWSPDKARTMHLGPVPAGRYLAGRSGGGLLWNLWDSSAGAWQVGSGRGNAFQVELCGHVMVDPYEVTDPDTTTAASHERRDGTGQSATEGSHAHDADQDLAEAGHGPVLSELFGHVVTIGEFSSIEEVHEVLASIDGTVEARVVSADTSPYAVAPGKWSLAVDIDEGAEPEDVLHELRAILPEFADRMWLSWG